MSKNLEDLMDDLKKTMMNNQISKIEKSMYEYSFGPQYVVNKGLSFDIESQSPQSIPDQKSPKSLKIMEGYVKKSRFDFLYKIFKRHNTLTETKFLVINNNIHKKLNLDPIRWLEYFNDEISFSYEDMRWYSLHNPKHKTLFPIKLCIYKNDKMICTLNCGRGFDHELTYFISSLDLVSQCLTGKKVKFDRNKSFVKLSEYEHAEWNDLYNKIPAMLNKSNNLWMNSNEYLGDKIKIFIQYFDKSYKVFIALPPEFIELKNSEFTRNNLSLEFEFKTIKDIEIFLNLIQFSRMVYNILNTRNILLEFENAVVV